MRNLALILATLALASCSGSRPSMPDRAINRALAGAPGQAQPSTIVSTELAFARMAREKGQWTAFKEFAADNALIFGANGAIEAKPWLAQQVDPAQAVQWEPHFVRMSCDGSLAVSQGAFQDPGGSAGTFYTVWERQQDGDYRYIFDFGFAQADAPAKPDLIGSAIGDCTAVGKPLPIVANGLNIRQSGDGTLAWTFQVAGSPATRYFRVWQAKGEEMATVIDVAVPPGAE